MAGTNKRAAVVGAGSSLGKEIAERLTSSVAAAWDVMLLDADGEGQVTAAGDEAMVIHSLAEESFAGVDVVFFAGDAESTSTTWKRAAAANSAVVDATGVLAGVAGVIASALGFALPKPDLRTVAVVPVQPGSWLLAKLVQAAGAHRAVATVLHPASGFGDKGMDELHAQTVALLSFATQPREIFDAQVAFTVRDAFGSDAKVTLESKAKTMREEIALMLGDAIEVEFQLLQAPVFHGLSASVWMEFAEGATGDVEERLKAAGFEVAEGAADEAEVSNQSVTSQDAPAVRVRTTERGAWAWVAVDNLRWTAEAAEGAALQLLSVRPSGTLQ